MSNNPQKRFPSNPADMVRSFWRNRLLMWQLIKREVVSRYRGSFLGLAWSFFNPVVLLIVYTFVFSFVFKARWNIETDSSVGFALALFVGLIAHGILAECMNRAPGLILSHVNYVKKVVFPLEILPWVVMGSNLFHACISFSVWSLFFLVVYQSFHWTVLFAPLVFLPLIFLTMGISWFLSSIGVFMRDIGQVVNVLTIMLLFLAPVFYPITLLPPPYRSYLYLNPLTFIIEQARGVLMLGELPNWMGLAVFFIISVCVAWLGFAWFQKIRKGFADVL